MGLSGIIAALPAQLQNATDLCCERLGERLSALEDHDLQRLLKAIACSEFFANLVVKDPDWLFAEFASLDRRQDCSDMLADELGDDDIDRVKAALRQYRNRYLARVYWRDLHGLATLDETLEDLSSLADRSLAVATRFAIRSLDERFGRVCTPSGEEVPLVVLGMGKLGGYELNFSSDIDLIFCYAEEGKSSGPKSISAHEYFGRLVQRIIALLDEVTVDGFVFRIDTRLRPFGDSGPPVVSFASLESYLLQHGRDWERYAYVKARIVGMHPGDAVAEELTDRLIRPFVYRRYLDYGVFDALREMHSMIATEVQRRDLADNLKLGPGGIREIEFIVQSIQLVRGGSEPALQGRELMRVLPAIKGSHGLTQQAAAQLFEAYGFLRRLENFIQAIRDQQTHDLPQDEVDRERLCLAMGFVQWTELLAELDRHRDNVKAHFQAIAFDGVSETETNHSLFTQLWELEASAEAWRDALLVAETDDAEALADEIVRFAASRAMQQSDATSQDRLRRFVPKLLRQVAQTQQPLAALRRCLFVVENVVRRSAYISLLNENKTALQRFVNLCEQSQYITDQLARHPVLLDELLDPRAWTDAITPQDVASELAKRLDGTTDSEDRMQRIASAQRATMFRIAIADFNAQLPIMKVSDGLTWLAEAILEEALRVAWQDLAEHHGEPEAGFGIVAYGKLGGLELSYGSDLDIVFLHNASGQDSTSGKRPLDTAMFFSRLVRRLVHFLTTQTGSGALYEVDTRLRPDGRSGLLVSGIESFEKYQEDNAWTWEHQALLRARPVAGSKEVAREFERIRHETLTRRVRRDRLRDDVISMRLRMRKELDRSDTDGFDLKHGQGGIGDIEFLVQFLVLREAAAHPPVIEFTDNIRQLDALMASEVLDVATGEELQNVYRRYRTRLHHLALDDRPPLVAPADFMAERQFVTNAWERWLA